MSSEETTPRETGTDTSHEVREDGSLAYFTTEVEEASEQTPREIGTPPVKKET